MKKGVLSILLFKLLFLFSQDTFVQKYPEKTKRGNAYDNFAHIILEEPNAYYTFGENHLNKDTLVIQILKINKQTGVILRELNLPTRGCKNYVDNVVLKKGKLYLFATVYDSNSVCNWSIEDYTPIYPRSVLTILDLNLNVILLNKFLTEVEDISRNLALVQKENYFELYFSKQKNLYKAEINLDGGLTKEIDFNTIFNFQPYWTFTLFKDYFFITDYDQVVIIDKNFQLIKTIALSGVARKTFVVDDRIYFILNYGVQSTTIDCFDSLLNYTKTNVEEEEIRVFAIYNNNNVMYDDMDYFTKSTLTEDLNVEFKRRYPIDNGDKTFSLIRGSRNLNAVQTSDGGFLIALKIYPNGEYNLIKTDCMGNTEWRTESCMIAPKIHFNIYPNPISETIAIQFPYQTKFQKLQLKIYDVLGKEVLNFTAEDFQTIYLDATTLEDGLYLYQLYESGKPISSGNFLKE